MRKWKSTALITLITPICRPNAITLSVSKPWVISAARVRYVTDFRRKLKQERCESKQTVFQENPTNSSKVVEVLLQQCGSSAHNSLRTHSIGQLVRETSKDLVHYSDCYNSRYRGLETPIRIVNQTAGAREHIKADLRNPAPQHAADAERWAYDARIIYFLV